MKKGLHDCGRIEDELYIYKEDGKWWLDINEEIARIIYYCPYCGEKLK